MDESKRKQLQQMLLLVLLLVILGASVAFMMKQINPANTRRGGRPPAQRVEAKGPSATNMPPVPGAPGDTGRSSKEAQEAASGAKQLNPNQFKVYALSPSKSPFVQQEGWYSDVLEEQLPGYPQLKQNEYFENDDLYLPDLDLITGGDKQWSRVTISRENKEGQYSIMGQNADGTVATSIGLEEAGKGSKTVTWTPESGVPLSELMVPGWEERYPDLASGKPPEDSAGTAPGSSADLFGGADGEGLGIPGEDGLNGLMGGAGRQDDIVCHGVTVNSGRAAAIISLNGRSFIVSEGGSLPPRYQVLEVKANGVVLVDSRDSSTKWVPLVEEGAAPPGDLTARPLR